MPDPTLSFTHDVKPLFRDKDRESTRGLLDLWSYPDVVAHAPAIIRVLKQGSMPCDWPWPPERIALFERWVAAGTVE